MVFDKELGRFELEVVGEFDSHNISKDSGKRFISIAKLIRDNKMQIAREELKYFEEIVTLGKEYEITEEEIRKKDRILKRERLNIEKTLKEMARLEKETINLEKVYRHEELLKNLEKLKGLRKVYVRSLVSKPVMELLGETEGQSLKEYYQVFQNKEEMALLKQFFTDYPMFGKYNASQICEFFEYSEKKLSHVCPETSRFKKLILGNRNLFETIGSLELTSFLAVNDENEKTLDFYVRDVKGAQEVVERIIQLKKEKNSDREEYEKNRQIEESKKDFAKYSKTVLENELKTTRSLLELLHSEALEEDTEEKMGLPLMISAFIKKLVGNS
ncbi:MAG: hypothetical protein ABID61_04825 [Candidatus Micrarchaeota archaeon]